MVSACWWLDDVSLFVSFPFSVKNDSLIEYHRSKHSSKSEERPKLQHVFPHLSRLNFLDLLLTGPIIEGVVVLELIFPLVDFGEGVVLAAPDMLDHLLLSLPAYDKQSRPDSYGKAINSIHWRIKSLLP